MMVASVVFMACACNKQENQPVEQTDNEINNPNTVVISAFLDENTKATVSQEGTFSWTEGDVVAYHTLGGEYLISGGASATAATADFTVSSAPRDAFAVFPSTIVAADAVNYGQEGHTLDVTLPSTYTLAQVSGYASVCPMIARNSGDSDSWSFKQLCGLLRIKVNTISPSANKITIDFNGKKVHGDFSISIPVPPGTPVIETNSDLSSDDDVITITFDPKGTWTDNEVINLPLPILPDPASNTYGTITITQKYNDTVLMTMEREIVLDGYSPVRAGGKGITAGFPVFTINESGDKVVFAPGILQATTTDNGTNWTFSFADYLSNSYRNGDLQADGTTTSANATINRFGWSTTSSIRFGISSSTNDGDYDGDFVDWGTNVIDGYAAGYWRSFSRLEANYMVDTRSASKVGETLNSRFVPAYVNGCSGYILFPDSYIHPKTAPALSNINSYCAYATNTITASQWLAMKGAGCVFLKTQYYDGASNAGPLFTHVWTSVSEPEDPIKAATSATTLCGQSAKALYTTVSGSMGRHYGCIVQLVKDVN